MTISNGFERAIYAVNPAEKKFYRSSSCTWQDDPKITVSFKDGWIAVLEDTGMHSHDWATDGSMTKFADQYGVDTTWKHVSRKEVSE